MNLRTTGWWTGLAALVLGLGCVGAQAGETPAVAQPGVTPAVEKALGRACLFGYYPAEGVFRFRLDFDRTALRLNTAIKFAATLKDARVAVRDAAGKTLAEKTVPVDDKKTDHVLPLPGLEGEYAVRFELRSPDTTVAIERPFERKKYKWENNPLGTGGVHPPFLPVVAKAESAAVVCRDYAFTPFGLFGQVTAESPNAGTLGTPPSEVGREPLLAAPMSWVYTVGGRTGTWKNAKVALVSSAPLAVYEAKADGEGFGYQAKGELDYDGSYKMTVTLSPAAGPVKLDGLYLDIPLAAERAPLMHAVADSIRINYAGKTPEGTGTVWQGAEAKRANDWQNDFVGYVWLGDYAGRGLAWYGENDRGYLTEKKNSKRKIQELVREPGRVSLRVHFVNLPSTLEKPTTWVFGLQASPVKPRPADWRSYIGQAVVWAGPVSPWGGTHCSAKYPWREDWTVVEKILDYGRGKRDDQFFKDYRAKNDPPNVFGNKDWVELMMIFANRVGTGDRFRRYTYAEEMVASTVAPEWQTFQSEWGAVEYTQRDWPDESVFRKGFNVNPSARVNFPASYVDYGVYYNNEWLQRGVSIYWDNDYLKATYNRFNSQAYDCGDGAIQPATNLWNMREYHKRVARLVYEASVALKEKQFWTTHMTNALVLPLHGFSDSSLDFEMGNGPEPFPSAMILAETSGNATGSFGRSLYPLLSRENPQMTALTKTDKDDAAFRHAMFALTHELENGHSPMSKKYDLPETLKAFGYGGPEVSVHHFYDRSPVLSVEPSAVLHLTLVDAKKRSALVALSNSGLPAAKAKLKFSGAAEWLNQAKFKNHFTNEAVDASAVDLPENYGAVLLRTEEAP